MKRKLSEKLKTGANMKIKGACERLSPRTRLITVVSFFVVFALVSVFMVIDSICDMGFEKREIDIDHMKELELKWAPKDSSMYNEIKKYFHDGTIK